MEEKKSSKVWSNFYGKTDRGVQFPENFVVRVFKSQMPVKFFDQNYETKKVLDLGCGSGRHIPFLQLQGFDVHGVELSESIVEALKRDHEGASFKVGSNVYIPYENDFFDYILSSASVYYMENHEQDITKNFDEVFRTIKKEGYFVFTLLGHKHSMFNESTEENSIYYIHENRLGFVPYVYVRPLGENEDVNNVYSGMEILFHGEVDETVADTCRHFHYFVAKKK